MLHHPRGNCGLNERTGFKLLTSSSPPNIHTVAAHANVGLSLASIIVVEGRVAGEFHVNKKCYLFRELR